MVPFENSGSVIKASLAIYKDRLMIRLDFTYDPSLIIEVKAIHGRIWSTTNKCWYVPDTLSNREKFKVVLSEEQQVLKQFRFYLETRRFTP